MRHLYPSLHANQLRNRKVNRVQLTCSVDEHGIYIRYGAGTQGFQPPRVTQVGRSLSSGTEPLMGLGLPFSPTEVCHAVAVRLGSASHDAYLPTAVIHHLQSARRLAGVGR